MKAFLHPHDGLRVRSTVPSDLEGALGYLECKPAENVFLSHLLRRDGLQRSWSRTWHLAERGGRACGLCAAASNVVPAAEDAHVARALARSIGGIPPGTQSLVGERACVAALWEALRRHAPPPRLVREEQPFYVLDRDGFSAAESPPPPRVRLRRARPDDLDVLVTSSADMLREEILDDPRERDPVGFRAQVWRMIREGDIFVGEQAGRVVFKAHASVRTPLAAQVSGVYTLPEHRGNGNARAAMHALSERLLRDHPQLCLYVNAGNQAAIRTYEGAGFRRAGTFSSIFFARA